MWHIWRRTQRVLMCLHCPLQQSEETHEAAAEENQNGHAEPEPGRPVRTLHRRHQHPLLLLQRDAQDPGKHVRHVCPTSKPGWWHDLFAGLSSRWNADDAKKSPLSCLKQDFEAVTPNLLARTIETVEGGGIVVILLRTMNSLKQLYTMTMVSPSLWWSHITYNFLQHYSGFIYFSFVSTRTCTPGTAPRRIRTWWAASTRGESRAGTWVLPSRCRQPAKPSRCFSDSFSHLRPAKTAWPSTTASTSCQSPATWQTSRPSPQRLRWWNHSRCTLMII